MLCGYFNLIQCFMHIFFLRFSVSFELQKIKRKESHSVLSQLQIISYELNISTAPEYKIRSTVKPDNINSYSFFALVLLSSLHLEIREMYFIYIF